MSLDLKLIRTGNILNYDTGEGVAPCVIDWQDLKWAEENPDDFLVKHSPIKLTLEELERLGFSGKNYKPGFIGIDVAHTDFVLDDNEVKEEFKYPHCRFYFLFNYGGWPRVKPFPYVHTLQNFFWAMYDQELIYKHDDIRNK